MKFLCENCKAKYQIGDDKVAGKTVRMKCRRCGHLIEVSASVTETSASRPPPADPAVPAPQPQVAPAAAAPFAAKPVHPGSLVGDEDSSDEHTVIMQAAPVRLAKPAAPGPAAGTPAAPRPAAGAPPRPGAVALRAVPSPRPTGNIAIASAQATARAPLAAEQPGVRALDAPLGIVSKATPSPQPVGVAGAFTRSVAQPVVAPAPPSRPTPSEDWYVGVGGVPLGPIRLSVIREKAGAGAVDGDSLVWREGFDEWQALKNFPELLEIVTEAQSSRMGGRRPSGMQPATPGLSHAAPAPAAVLPKSEVSSSSHGSGKGSLAEMARLAASASVAPAAPAVSSPSADPFTKPTAASPVDLLSDPFAAPAAPRPAEPAMAPAPAPRPPSHSSHDLTRDSFIGRQPRRRGLHPMAYAFIAMAGVFGAVAAYVLLVKPPAAPTVVYVPGATVIVHDQAAAPDATGATTVATSDSSAPSTRPMGGAQAGRIADAKSAAPAAATAGGLDLSGFGGTGVQGPSAQGPNGAAASAGGGQLTAGDISSVVNQNQTIIKRKCWQAALDAKTKENVNSAKVTASLTIGPSGDVTSVSASGGESAFPTLAGCIAGRIKSWKFPPSGGSTPVSVPFVFAGQ